MFKHMAEARGKVWNDNLPRKEEKVRRAIKWEQYVEVRMADRPMTK